MAANNFRALLPVSHSNILCVPDGSYRDEAWSDCASIRATAQFQEILTFTPTLEHFARFSTYGVFFAYDYRDTYIGPLWTMPYELAGSFIALLSALALRHTRWRLCSFLVMAAIILRVAPGDYKMLALFPVGCALADCHLRGWFSSIPNPLGVALICFGFAIPIFVPYSVAAWGSAATLLVLGSISIPDTHTFLENRLSSWLGAICFPLYLIHGPVIWLMGEPLMRVGARDRSKDSH